MYDLSICIPARNEEWLGETIKDILKNKRGNTEIIVVLDGWWPNPGIEDHKDLTIIHLSEAVGQRAGQNLAVKTSRAKWIMKVDAHCAFDEGFDVKMLEQAEEDMTLVPVMRNLHVFNWKCDNCGMETYQGPELEQCRNEECVEEKQSFTKKLVWNPKPSPQSSAYRFNKNLQFKYFPELRRKQGKGLVETMSLQGSCFMCTREKYWQLGLCDEEWGSWGQQGSEVAIKTWLSGGRVMCNMDTWYAHLFRTRHGFSFPYPMSGRSQEKARKISQDIFKNNKWEHQKYPLSWLLEKFWEPLQEVGDNEARWEQKDLDDLKKVPLKPSGPTKGILYYTTNRLPLKLAKRVQRNLKGMGLPITSVSLKPMEFGHNIHIPLQPGKWAYFTQIIAGLENIDTDIVFMAEHDVLYDKSHFDFTPEKKDTFYFNHNWWRIREDGFAVSWDADQISQMCAYRETLLNWYYQKRDEILEKGFNRSYEPQGNKEAWKSENPNFDIRPKGTITGNKWSPKDFRNKSSCVNWQESDLEQLKRSDIRDILKI